MFLDPPFETLSYWGIYKCPTLELISLCLMQVLIRTSYFVFTLCSIMKIIKVIQSGYRPQTVYKSTGADSQIWLSSSNFHFTGSKVMSSSSASGKVHTRSIHCNNIDTFQNKNSYSTFWHLIIWLIMSFPLSFSSSLKRLLCNSVSNQ